MRVAFARLSCAVLLGTSACSSESPDTTSGVTNLKPAACVTGAGTTTLFTGNVSGIATDGSEVFVTGDTIDGVALSGGPAVTLATPQDPYGLSYLKGNLYFSASEPAGSPNAEGKVSSEPVFESVPVAGGTPAVIPGLTMGNLASATDADSLYYDGIGSSVVKLTPPSTSPTTLPLDGSILIDAIAVHGEDVHVAGEDLASPDSFGNGVIERVPKGGGSAERIVSNIGHPQSLVADDTGLYWEQDPLGFEGEGTIVRANLDGSSATTLASASARSLAVANSRLYFASDAIYTMQTSGGTPTVVASGLTTPGMLLVVGGNLVWADPTVKAFSDPTVPRVMTACAPD